MLAASNEWMIWRRQLVGVRNPLSDNPMGSDPKGLYWKTEDLLVQAIYQGPDLAGNLIVRSQIAPVTGDLIVRLEGMPQSEAAAKVAARAEYLQVNTSPDVRRDGDGKIIMSKIYCTADKSGHWQEYGQTPRQPFTPPKYR